MSKLDIDDVVEIKRLLLKGELTQKQIADKFNISRGTVAKIKNGYRHKDVEIDSDGNHIKREILPEDYKVQYKKEEQKQIIVKADSTTEYRKEFIENYFNKKVKQDYKDDYIVIHLEPASRKSKRFIGGLWNNRKWLFNNEWDDFISFIMSQVVESVMHYKPIDINFNWSMVNDESTKENQLLHSYLNKAIKARLLDYANQLNNNYLEQKNNVKEWKKTEIDSVDETVENDGAETAIIDTLSDEHNHFKLKDNYVASPFLNWFKDNHKDFLTDKQIEFLNVYKFYVGIDSDYVKPYRQIEIKPYTESQITHNRRRIKERTEKEWEKYQNDNNVTTKNSDYAQELRLWNQFIDIVNDEIEEQNKRLSKWIKSNLDNNYFENVLYKMDKRDILNVKKKTVPSLTLYNLFNLIDYRIKEIESLTLSTTR